MYATTLRGELEGVVAECVDHEEGQGFVGLDAGVGGGDVKRNACAFKGGTVLGYDVEHFAQGEGGDVHGYVTAAYLYPLREGIVDA